MKNFSEHHAVKDEDIIILQVENQIFYKGEKIKINHKIYEIQDIINPVIRLQVKEIPENG